MKTIIALAGNPNSGKTTLFNELTGSNQYVGNWPGVTVEERNGVLRGHADVIVQDLPGIYSLSPYSLEERISRNFLVKERPSVALNIVDGANIERNLYLTTQLLETGVKVVVAVNMMDLVERSGGVIDFGKLAKRLGCAVVGICAQRGRGCEAAVEAALAAAEGPRGGTPLDIYTGCVRQALARIEELIRGKVPAEALRWCAVKVFERDADARAGMGLSPDVLAAAEAWIAACERELNDDAESIITAQRYRFIQDVVAACVVKGARRAKGASLSDRIDRFVTNRLLAIPIFCLALLAMYWLAVAEGGPGTRLTDWANDEFLGEGWTLPFTGIGVPGVAKICAGLCTWAGLEEGSLAYALVNDGAMNPVAVIVVAALVALAALAVRRNLRRGGGCACGCRVCGRCAGASRFNETKTNKENTSR
ncbi:MAG: FeoB small GTPase domain-containing protein [Kiritimatiellia bacterium]